MHILTVQSGEHHVGGQGFSDGVIVNAAGSAIIHCREGKDKITVNLFGDAQCFSREGCFVDAHESSSVQASGGLIHCNGEASALATGNAVVIAREQSHVTSKEAATGYIFGRASLRAFDNSRLVFMSEGKLEVHDLAEVDYAPRRSTQPLKLLSRQFEDLAASLHAFGQEHPALGAVERANLESLLRTLQNHDFTTLRSGLRIKNTWAAILAVAGVGELLSCSDLF